MEGSMAEPNPQPQLMKFIFQFSFFLSLGLLQTVCLKVAPGGAQGTVLCQGLNHALNALVKLVKCKCRFLLLFIDGGIQWQLYALVVGTATNHTLFLSLVFFSF